MGGWKPKRRGNHLATNPHQNHGERPINRPELRRDSVVHKEQRPQAQNSKYVAGVGNVPEFVITNVRYPSMFNFKEDRARSEYILSVSKFYPIKNMQPHRRRKVERQIEKVGEHNIITKSLDLAKEENRELLWQATLKWQARGINNYGKFEQDAMRICIDNAEALGIENVCLFVKGQLYGFCLYHESSDKRYVTAKHIEGDPC
jgi:hypothetical protein